MGPAAADRGSRHHPSKQPTRGRRLDRDQPRGREERRSEPGRTLQRRAPEWVRPPRWLLILVTFHLVALLWVLFRAPDLATAATVLNGCLGGASFDNAAAFLGAHLFEGALILAFFLIHPWDDGRRIRIMAKTLPPVVVVALMLVAFVLVIVIGAESPAQFIYFEF
jgi:alginate O-acetyltransferase complex protein AlgI